MQPLEGDGVGVGEADGDQPFARQRRQMSELAVHHLRRWLLIDDEIDAHHRQLAGGRVAEERRIGARGRGALQRFALGSVSAKLSHNAPTSLLIVRD